MKYLAGLQQIRYVFVYPERARCRAGRARRRLEGRSSGRNHRPGERPAGALARRSAGGIGRRRGLPRERHQLLDRSHGRRPGTAQVAGQSTAQGRDRDLVRHGGASRKHSARKRSRVGGVPDVSHFARVLVAADYRMKRLAMGFEPAPIKGLPSFLQMSKGGRGMGTMLPRWWLEPDYGSVLADENGTAWEIRGAHVRAATEDDVLKESGAREHTGKANPLAKKWADKMIATLRGPGGQGAGLRPTAQLHRPGPGGGLDLERGAAGPGRLPTAKLVRPREAGERPVRRPAAGEHPGQRAAKRWQLADQRLGGREAQRLGDARRCAKRPTNSGPSRSKPSRPAKAGGGTEDRRCG